MKLTLRLIEKHLGGKWWYDSESYHWKCDDKIRSIHCTDNEYYLYGTSAAGVRIIVVDRKTLFIAGKKEWDG